MEIREEHVRWAVLHRMGEMLKESVDDTFSTTAAFMAFQAIVAWVREDLGRYRSFAEHPRALTDLRRPRGSKPWSVPAEALAGQAEVRPFEGGGVRRFDLGDPAVPMWLVLVWLRNAMSHGDGRTIMPIHRPVVGGDGEHELVGFRFENRGGVAALDADTMRRVGSVLVNGFCAAYGDFSIERDAPVGVVEKRNDA